MPRPSTSGTPSSSSSIATKPNIPIPVATTTVVPSTTLTTARSFLGTQPFQPGLVPKCDCSAGGGPDRGQEANRVACRHSLADTLRQQGVYIKSAQDLLGSANVLITQCIYQQVVSEEKRPAKDLVHLLDSFPWCFQAGPHGRFTARSAAPLIRSTIGWPLPNFQDRSAIFCFDEIAPDDSWPRPVRRGGPQTASVAASIVQEPRSLIYRGSPYLSSDRRLPYRV